MAGLHLLVDARATAHLSDRVFVEDWLRDAAAMAGMTVIGSQSHLLPTAHDSGPGVSAIVLLAESHATVHTWSDEGVVAMDFYSCQPYDDIALFASFTTAFGVTEILTRETVIRYGVPVRADA